ncbi:5-oxoprolinase subunit C family protein [Halobacillus karajensis]|uniref:KipI antagonist n=1 Tax=Halobacillus karajensis TaxID=195088 RepID=A0A024P6S1_9BACI|nr:biotin-dependent carboxyltransferase family protein [Halobacillus karajensis]CDQ20489.1 KipI antagonist [Halobacillus karajensis]CDQ24042.1 KipI antagonist [Halobacillus karajensis]CDQ27520.1 KipI antagonist [Halobacillus karajensis]
MISVLKAGLMTTIQDLGRYGYQKDGVITSGAMDQEAHKIANLLVGNPIQTATIEITLMGPVLEFHEDSLIAISGGDLTPVINGEPVSMWRPIYIKKGSELRFGKPKKGFRSYLSIAGGFKVPQVMDSSSTYLRANIGGVEGRPLQRGDTISSGTLPIPSKRFMKMLQPERKHLFNEASWFVGPEFTTLQNDQPIRVMPGREFDLFSKKSQEDLFQSEFQIDSKSDRMGYRLNGKPLHLLEQKNILSEAVTFGTIQVPPEGNPIILLADHQTTGGYPKIGQIASVDLPKVAQMRPGDPLAFEQISHKEAQRLLLEREKDLKQLQRGIETK